MLDRRDETVAFYQAQVGPHIIELERPDVVHIHYGGDVELAHFLGLDEVVSLFPPPSPLYLLRDARRGGFVRPETRKHIASNQQGLRFIAILTYGSSFQSKTVFANMNRALRLVSKNTVHAEFFDTEEQARAWIAEHRALSK